MRLVVRSLAVSVNLLEALRPPDGGDVLTHVGVTIDEIKVTDVRHGHICAPRQPVVPKPALCHTVSAWYG